ncbi:MAG: aldo/keto reductase [Dehalococcoidia bacterium]|nr:aldo/keto reductase [Dehalococcoidia bacterium]
MNAVDAVALGRSRLKVSKLCFGTAYLGAPSLKISPDEGGRVLVEAHKLGVTFWDTSDDYGSHAHIASALRHIPREKVVISTKTSAKNGREAAESLQRSLRELGTDYVDIFFLHAVESDWIDGCHKLLTELHELTTAGTVKAIGLTTHSVAVGRKASEFEQLDVLMTICCGADQATIDRFPEHIPLEDGTIEQMLEAAELAHSRGIGIVAMKVLGCSAPPLVDDYRASIEAVTKLRFVDAIVIGMRSLCEVQKNVEAVMSR